MKIKENLKTTNEFICQTCNSGTMNQPEIENHLLEAHGINAKGIKATSRTISHMDGTDWYSSVNEIKFTDGPTILQNFWSERSKNDPMRF